MYVFDVGAAQKPEVSVWRAKGRDSRDRHDIRPLQPSKRTVVNKQNCPGSECTVYYHTGFLLTGQMASDIAQSARLLQVGHIWRQRRIARSNSKWHLRMQPRKCNLPWGAVMPCRHRFDLLDNLQVLQRKQDDKARQHDIVHVTYRQHISVVSTTTEPVALHMLHAVACRKSCCEWHECMDRQQGGGAMLMQRRWAGDAPAP